MGIINLEDLRPDMVLDGDVAARNGRILLRSGGVVTEKHIKIFQTWGITEADVQGVTKDDVSASAAQKIDPKIYKETEESIRARFCFFNPAHAFSDELIRICVSRKFQSPEVS